MAHQLPSGNRYRSAPNALTIGTRVTIIDSNFHQLEPERRNELPDLVPVILVESVWLAGRFIVPPGVTNGARSVVTHKVPANWLAAGDPAGLIRSL